LYGRSVVFLSRIYPSAPPFEEEWSRPKSAPEMNGFAVFYSVVLEFRWSCAAADRIKIEEEKSTASPNDKVIIF
jgi:hypothetical protein